MPMRYKMLIVKAECHQCRKFRVRTGLADEYDSDDLASDAVQQLQKVDQCPHKQSEMEITVTDSNDRKPRKKYRYV
jgi:hypothetical protein